MFNHLTTVTFKGRAGSEPFSVSSSDVTTTPKGRSARLARAAAESMATALGLREMILAQTDEAPALVVAAVDCPLGRQLVEARWGAMAPHSVCGPIVFAMTMAELAAAFGAAGQRVAAEAKALGESAPGAPVFAFAVNGMGLDLRVMVPVPPAPVADPVDADDDVPDSRPDPIDAEEP